jgi:hypothetical protein
MESKAEAPRQNDPPLRQTSGWLDQESVLAANLCVQSVLAATLWVQLVRYSQTGRLKTKGVLTARGQLMGPSVAELWV